MTARFIGRWYFQGDAVHILLTLPIRSLGCGCNEPHCWYVSRDGRTRCWLCDDAYVKERDAQFAAGVAAEQAAPSERNNPPKRDMGPSCASGEKGERKGGNAEYTPGPTIPKGAVKA